MAKFITLTNMTPPYENKKIAINVDKILTIYKDLTNKNHTTLWCNDSSWIVKESLEDVLELIESKGVQK